MRFLLLVPSICFFLVLSANDAHLNQSGKAEELYQAGDTNGAYLLYKVMSNKTPMIWYKMGNAAYKNKHYVQAIAHWYRALKEGGASFAHNCMHNINMAYTKIEISSQPTWYDHVMYYTGFPSLFLLQLLFLLAWYLLGAIFVLCKRYRLICMGILFLFLCIETVGLLAAQHFWNRDFCIICADKASLHVGPDPRFASCSEIPKASRVQIVGQRRGWYQVQANGQSGWISAEDIELV